MKSVANIYKGFGKVMRNRMQKTGPNLMEGVQPPIWQTPGKLQYYRAEMEPFLPDEIKWQIRQPTRFATSSPKMTYLEQIKEEVNKFLGERIKHHYLNPEKNINLNLSVAEAEILIGASSMVKELAEKGALKTLHENCKNISEKAEGDYLTIKDKIDRIIQAVEERENEIYQKYNESTNGNLRLHGSASLIGSILSKDYTVSNFRTIEKSGDSTSIQQLQSLMAVKIKATDIKCLLAELYSNKVAKQASWADNEHGELKKHRDHMKKALKDNSQRVTGGECESHMSKLHQIEEHEAEELYKTFIECEKFHNEKANVYGHYMSAQSPEALDQFRTELLQHLAGSIIVKEHRKRYQKEQYERFAASMGCINLKKTNQTLEQFSEMYAQLIESLILESHNDLSPKIEANYDDFRERTIRPLNATIFYYFFSGDRSRRTVAQWLLSTIRYPNERVKRAYMRFFA